jgi:hypothetical protein
MHTCQRNNAVLLWLKRNVEARNAAVRRSQLMITHPRYHTRGRLYISRGSHQSVTARIIQILVITHISTKPTSVLRVGGIWGLTMKPCACAHDVWIFNPHI